MILSNEAKMSGSHNFQTKKIDLGEREVSTANPEKFAKTEFQR